MIYSSPMLALALMKLRRSGVPSQSRCWSVVAKSCWRQWGRSDSQRELANVRWWCHRLVQLRSTLRVISVLTDNPYSQAMLWMLSDGRQFVRLILFQSSTPDTILCRWKTIDGYRPGHYSVNNSARWCQLSRWIAHSSRHILYFSRNQRWWWLYPPLSALTGRTFANFCKWRLRFFRLFFDSNNCTGLLQRCDGGC